MPKATLTFYTISEFGYFKRNDPTPLISDIPSILEQIKTWGDTLGQIQYTRQNGIDKRGCYLVEAKKLASTNNFLLVLWNESHNLAGNVPSIFLTSLKGDPLLAENTVEEGSVPGFPTYFLFMPDSKKIASIRFEGDSTCMPNLSIYMQGFMRTFAKHAVKVKTDEGISIAGYRINPEDQKEPTKKLRPRVKIKLVPKPSDAAAVLADRGKIRAVIRQEVLSTKTDTERTRLSKILDWFRNDAPGSSMATQSTKTIVEIDYTPTEQELVQLIAQFQKEEIEDFDLGFKISGESRTRWLGKGSLQEHFELDVEHKKGIVTMASLARELNKVRTQVIALANG